MSYICEICDERPCNVMKHTEVLEEEIRQLKQLIKEK